MMGGSAAPAYPVRRPLRRGRSRQRPSDAGLLPRSAFRAPLPLSGFSPSASGPRTSCLVGETLANDTTEHLVGASRIIAAVRNAVAVAELELGKIPVQVLLGAELIDAAHPALEDGKRALDGVGSHVTAHIFLVVVHDRTVFREFAANAAIHDVLVSHQAGFAGQVLKHDALNFLATVNVEEAAAPSVAIDQGKHGHLVTPTALRI